MLKDDCCMHVISTIIYDCIIRDELYVIARLLDSMKHVDYLHFRLL